MVDVRRHTTNTGYPYSVLAHVSFSCSCGWTTEWFRDSVEAYPTAEMREHLAQCHAGELELGPCSTCGTITDHFRAVSHLGTAWLCERHTPSMSQAP